jgi:hypothetical protein
MVADYTWSKLLTDADSSEPWIAGFVGAGVGGSQAQNNYNRKLEKSYSVLDIPAMFKVTAAYDLPFGPKRRFLGSGIAGKIVGNWNLSTYTFAQSGYPLGVVQNGFNNLLYGGPVRPDVTSYDWRAPTSGGSFDPYREPYLSRDPFIALTDPTVKPFGDAPRFVGTTRSPARVRSNIAVARAFQIKERAHADFRWEVYDLFNAKTWNNPNLDLSNADFGKIFNASGNRSMQVSLKLIF